MAFQQDSTADSVTSSPRSDHLNRWQEEGQSSVRFMCSFGGRILPRPHDNQLRYVGGDTRIVAVHRSTTFESLLSKLSKLSGISDITVKYQLPNEDLDALISVTTDEDVDNMLDEYERSTLAGITTRAARLRLFLFPPSVSRTSSISSILHGGSAKQWFLDALNGSASLERGRSEVSSVLSEVPDYLFGLDTEFDTKSKTRNVQFETLSVLSDPGSPASRVAPSPYCSMSSAGGVPADLPPVKTKVEDQGVAGEIKENRIEVDPQLQQQTNHAGNPVFSYISESQLHGQAVHQAPVYYMPSGNLPIRPYPMAVPYMQRVPVPATAGQMYRYPFIPNPVGGGQVYGQMMRPDEINVVNAYDPPPGMIPDGGQVIYGQRNPGMIPAYGLGVVPVGGDLQMADAEVKMGMI